MTDGPTRHRRYRAPVRRLAGRRRPERARAAGRAGRAVRAAGGVRPAAASGRGLRDHAASRRHGPALSLAPGRGGGGQRAADYAMLETESLPPQPGRVVFTTAQPIRLRIEVPIARSDFPIVEELRAEGVSDYLIQPLPFTNGEVHAISWTTTRPGGFDDADLAALDAVRRPLRAPRRDLHAASHGDHPARHLRRPARRRAHPAGPDPARRHRAHRSGDHADRSARLHDLERPAARRPGDRPAEQLFRLPGAADRGARRRGAEVHRRRPARDLRRGGRRRRRLPGGPCREPRKRVQASRRPMPNGSTLASLRCATAWRCTSATSSTATSAAPSASTSPRSVPRST